MAPTGDQALEQAYAYFQEQKLEPYPEKQLTRLLTTAHHQFETDFFAKIEQSLSSQTKKILGQLIKEDQDSVGHSSSPEKIPALGFPTMTLGQLKENQARLKIDSILYEIEKSKALDRIKIPKIIESFGSRKLFVHYYERVLIESPSHIRKNKPSLRYAYLAIFCVIRQQLMADTLADLLLKLLHRILTKAETAVDRALKQDNKRVKGKLGTLLLLAKQSVDNPEGIIKETIYPEVPKDRLIEIVTDLGCDDHWYRNQVKTKALSLYSRNNRRLVWVLMKALEFDTKPKLSPMLKALTFLKKIHTEGDEERFSLLKERLYDPIF